MNIFIASFSRPTLSEWDKIIKKRNTLDEMKVDNMVWTLRTVAGLSIIGRAKCLTTYQVPLRSRLYRCMKSQSNKLSCYRLIRKIVKSNGVFISVYGWLFAPFVSHKSEASGRCVWLVERVTDLSYRNPFCPWTLSLLANGQVCNRDVRIVRPNHCG